jgi:uncharacterized glyoxalase superfamily protein PhnB
VVSITAVLTGNTERCLEFYAAVFGAAHAVLEERDGGPGQRSCGAGALASVS